MSVSLCLAKNLTNRLTNMILLYSEDSYGSTKYLYLGGGYPYSRPLTLHLVDLVVNPQILKIEALFK